MKLARCAVFVLPLAILISAPAEASKKHHKGAAGGWDGRWVGAWGGSQPTAQIIKGNKLVAYEYNGQVHPVASSHVTPKQIVYGTDVVVTITRTGANTANATIKTGQGEGTTVLTRQ